ncbi:hypothetical protein CDAR_177281 [Caerostris darwini]|uniref:Uncharacterized protein n=1 Tax=Caerostris darwini TaxID=1538125 RepID=A0AAV4TQ38_9ARAC|nr:hypothetical protein CDAR_177281 [Caerostris darwini]
MLSSPAVHSAQGSVVITEDEPLLRAITPSSSDCFMATLMSDNGSGIVALTPLEEIEETDHLLRGQILLFLKVSFYSYWGCTYIFSSLSERLLRFSEYVKINSPISKISVPYSAIPFICHVPLLKNSSKDLDHPSDKKTIIIVF